MIVVFGTLNVDLVVPVDRFPGPGEEVKGADHRFLPGGKGANQALAAARAGARVALVGAVGDDAFAAIALDGLAAAGVDLSRVDRVGRPTGFNAIAVDRDGENMLIGSTAANAAARAEALLRLVGPDTTLLVQNSLPATTVAEAIAIARRAGASIVYNTAPSATAEEASLAAADVVVANTSEARGLAARFGLPEEPAAFVRAAALRFAARVVVTLGGDGLVAATPGGTLFRGRPPQVAVVDTTGAGDALCGALTAALDRGEDFPRALAEGLAAGAAATRGAGARSSLADLAEIRRLADAMAPITIEEARR